MTPPDPRPSDSADLVDVDVADPAAPAAPRSAARRPRIVCVGDNDMDVYADHGLEFPGGNCLNVAVFAARAGADAAYVGRVGPDARGAAIARALEAEGVDVRHLARVPGETAHCVIRHVGGDRRFESNDLGVSRFEPTAEEFAFVDGQDAVHVGATSGLDAHVPRLARRALLSYDFATVRDSHRIRRIAPHAHLLAFSGGGLDPLQANDLAELAVDAGATWALVTRGAQGALLARGRERWAVEAVRADVVDTLGAGDSFIARVLVGLVSGELPQDALAAAARAAARTCATHGAFGHPRPLTPAPAPPA